MDDEEDFEALFFSECVELLGDLQHHLELLASGGGDHETVNAAFRAVHSVKGGAAAFGYDDLISFAHVFETAMDQIRSGNLDLDGEVSELLLRAGDVMELLLERAQTQSDESVNAHERVLLELQALIGQSPEASGQETVNSEKEELLVTDVLPEADGTLETIVFSFSPGDDFFRSGHDPLRLIRAAREKGLTSSEISGEVPPLETIDISRPPYNWLLKFETCDHEDEIWNFLSIYTASAEFEVISNTRNVSKNVMQESHSEEQPKASLEDECDKIISHEGTSLQGQAPCSIKVKPEETSGPKGPVSKSLRVEMSRVDRLVNLVGEMLITQAGLAQKLTASFSANQLDLSHSAEALSRQLRELQENVMAIRAQPIKLVFSRMPRVVRDLSDKLGKKAHLEICGEGTEIDANVIEELAEPLTHMIRNSMDHGLEHENERKAVGKPPAGTIKLSAEHHGERVIIVIEDDGRGINREVVLCRAIERGFVTAEDTLSPNEIDALIFHPGFSTAQEVSSISGRGVGMDVVKKKIQTLGGRCIMTSTPGKGTRFTISLPLTMAVMDGMLVSVDNQQFIVPLSTVVEVTRLQAGDIKHLPNGNSVIDRRGEYIRILSLRRLLKMPKCTINSEMVIFIETETDGYIALIVDELIGQKQVVLKSLEANYQRITGVSGATILGDGKVALILDIPSLVQLFPNNQQKLKLAS